MLNFNYFRPIIIWNDGESTGYYPDNVDKLIIFEGLKSHEIIKNAKLIENYHPVCSVKTSNKKAVEIYELNGTFICIIDESNYNFYSTLADTLNPWCVRAKECIIVTLQPLMSYKTNEMQNSSIIRSINSTSCKDIKELEVPNFFCNTSAALITKRISSDSDFSAFVIYVDVYDIASIKLILNHLHRIGMPESKVSVRPLHHQSDLYM
jgi:hypothetical protein